MNPAHTIFALATPPGKSGVAVIRISGPDASKALTTLSKKNLPPPRLAKLYTLYDIKSEEIIDKSLVFYFKAPHSFTGEDVAELHIHGSRAIINSILKNLSDMKNIRIAEPGEFSKRAFLNSKMDLTEAEGLADLIDAETQLQHKQAMRQYSGELRNLYESWRKKLIQALSFLEAYIDFPDEDIPADITNTIEENIRMLKEQISNHLNDNHQGERLRSGIHAAILGAPNAGKSTLLNYLARRDVAIVSNIAGTTRDVIEVHLEIAGVPVIFADTAGIRKSDDTIEAEGIRRALDRAKSADIKIILLDSTNIDKKALELVDEKTIVLLNKIDQNKDINIDLPHIATSIKENIGMQDFLFSLEEMVKKEISPSADPLITRVRYRKNLQECLESLYQFSLDNVIELACEDLRLAARSLGQITGVIDIDTILDEIFCNFCIGK